jgi:hypothetical protein
MSSVGGEEDRRARPIERKPKWLVSLRSLQREVRAGDTQVVAVFDRGDVFEVLSRGTSPETNATSSKPDRIVVWSTHGAGSI